MGFLYDCTISIRSQNDFESILYNLLWGIAGLKSDFRVGINVFNGGMRINSIHNCRGRRPRRPVRRGNAMVLVSSMLNYSG